MSGSVSLDPIGQVPRSVQQAANCVHAQVFSSQLTNTDMSPSETSLCLSLSPSFIFFLLFLFPFSAMRAGNTPVKETLIRNVHLGTKISHIVDRNFAVLL